MLGYRLIQKKIVDSLKLNNRILKSQFTEIESGLIKVIDRQWDEAINRLSRSEQSTVVNHLIQLTHDLKKFSIDEQARAWLSKGLLEISTIISNQSNSLPELLDCLIRALVKHSQANQGAIFVLDEEDGSSFLKMMACYAYNKKKYLNNRVAIGAGLVGQCFLEGEIISMTDIPKDYIKITSGLGEALPRNVVLIPIKSGDDKVGVIELAFFEKVLPSTIKYIEASAELISRAIHSHKVHQETVVLLAKSEEMSRSLKDKEGKFIETIARMEEMQKDLSRQNLALEKTTKELEVMRQRETEMIESKLNVQQLIHDKIVTQLKSKIETLTKQIERLQPLADESPTQLMYLNLIK